MEGFNEKLEQFFDNQENSKFDYHLDLIFYTNFSWFESDYIDNYRRNFKEIKFIEYLANCFNFYDAKRDEFDLFSDEKHILKVAEKYKDDIPDFENGLQDFEFVKSIFKSTAHEIDKIKSFLDRQIFYLKQKQSDSKNIEAKPEKAILKIRMLHETGIIEFLQNKYPEASNRSICRFFSWLTDNSITENRSSEFSTDPTNAKHPIENLSDPEKKVLDDKMKEFKFL